MKNKVFIIYIVQAIVMIIFFVLSNKYVNNKIINKSSNYLDAFNNGWYMFNENGDKIFIEAPSKQNVESGKKLVIYNQLPDNNIENITLCFPTIHSFVKVYASDELIYSFGLERETMANTPGCCWNFIEFSERDHGKIIKIEILSNYSYSSGSVPSFMIGTMYSTKCNLLKNKLLDLVIVFFTMIISVILIVFSIMSRKKYYVKDNLIYTGLFAFMVSSWQLMDSHILPVFIGHYYLLNMLSFVFLLMAAFPFIEYIRNTYICSKKELPV